MIMYLKMSPTQRASDINLTVLTSSGHLLTSLAQCKGHTFRTNLADVRKYISLRTDAAVQYPSTTLNNNTAAWNTKTIIFVVTSIS